MTRWTWVPVLAMTATWACSGGRPGTGTDIVAGDPGPLADEARDDGTLRDETAPETTGDANDARNDDLAEERPGDLGTPDEDGTADGTDVDLPADFPDVPDATVDPGLPDGEAGSDVPAPPPPLFDLAAIRDPATAQCDFHDHRTAWQGLQVLDVWRLSYWSWESVDGVLRPIRIRAFAARPAGSGTLPGVVSAHGLGGFAEESHATGQAALLGMFVIAYTGPGGGKPDDPDTQSEGIPAGDAVTGSFYRLFDTVPDPRGSWLWGHAVAAMRAVTCLETRGDVDAERLGITGGSAGAMVSLIASGVDDRIQAAVPFSGTGAFEVAVQAPAAWQHGLLAASGLTTDSPQWTAFLEHVDPIRHVPATQAAILMVNGSCDEFFPLTAHVATYDAVPESVERRTSIVANFDHGCYTVIGIEPQEAIDQRVAVRFPGNARAWFQHHFDTSPTYARLPAEPVVQVTDAGGLAMVAALVDPGTDTYDVERVWYWFSNDDAYTFLSVELQDQGSGLWGALVPAPLQDNTVYYVDVQYKTKSFFAPERFAVSSRPRVPQGLIPHIRQWETCL